MHHQGAAACLQHPDLRLSMHVHQEAMTTLLSPLKRCEQGRTSDRSRHVLPNIHEPDFLGARWYFSSTLYPAHSSWAMKVLARNS